MARPTFYIIDGHAHIYRAYFAPFRDLTSPAGEPTKATFVFTQMLLNLVEQRKPDYLAMVIDSGDETVFRKEIDPQYKANRPARPDDFEPQERRILRIVRDAGVPLFEKPGFEADDLVATMTRVLRERGFDVFLVSKDKDLRQLLDEHVVMYDAVNGDVFDVPAMQAKLGYSPSQAIDVQTLVGDSTDNVKGVPGVGEKTAAELIARFQTIEGIYANLDQLKTKKKLVENLLAARQQLPVTRKLVTLRDDVPMDFDPEACRFDGFRVEPLLAHLRELGFKSLEAKLLASATRRASDAPMAPASVGRAPASASTASSNVPPAPESPTLKFSDSLFDDAPASAPAETAATPAPTMSHLATSSDCDYRAVTDEATLAALVAELRTARRFAFDTETDALRAVGAGLVGMSFSTRAGSGWYVPLRAPAGTSLLPRQRVFDALVPLLEDPTLSKVGHNIKYDLLVMRTAGVNVRGVSMDTMVASFVLDSGRVSYGIDRLAEELLRFRKISTESLIGKGRSQITMDRVPLESITRYAAEDADIALRLADLFTSRLEAEPTLRKLHDELETPLIDVLVEMEWAGIAVDPAVLAEQSRVLGERIDELRNKIHQAAGVEFNIDSPKQLGELLFTRLGLRSVKKTKTGNSTDVEVLESLADKHPVPRLVLEYRSLVKLKNTYLDQLADQINPTTGRIHTSFNQTGAATGRLSSSDPNLQNIPIRTDEGRRIRLAFVPGDAARNVLLTADYSQIELRVLAHLSEEPALIEAFRRDEDIHAAVAAQVFGVDPSSVTREQRTQAKTINFGIVYGVTASGLARRIEGLSQRGAETLIADYHRRFPRIKRFLDQCVEQARRHGYVETILGRRRPVREIDSRIVQLRNAAERVAINSVVQGSAADLIKVAMVNIHRRLRDERRRSRMLLQVHDELVFETSADQVEREAELVREEMTNAMTLSVPLKVEVGFGKNWQEVK
jgi:DNA polymerase-1